MQRGAKLPSRKLPFTTGTDGHTDWEETYEELLRWVDRGESDLIEWVKDDEPQTEEGDIHVILDYGRKRKKKGRKNSLWESSERRKAKSKPNCNIRIEYRVPKDVATLESEGFDLSDVQSFEKRAPLRPRVISWMKDKGIEGPIRKLVHTVAKKSLGSAVFRPSPMSPRSITSPRARVEPSMITFPLSLDASGVSLLSPTTTTAANHFVLSPTSATPPPSPAFSSSSLAQPSEPPPVTTTPPRCSSPPSSLDASQKLVHVKCIQPNSGSIYGRELVKIFGANLITDELKILWNNTPVEFVCKNDSEAWFASLPGHLGTSAVVKIQQGAYSHQFSFNHYAPSEQTHETHIRQPLHEAVSVPSLASISVASREVMPNNAALANMDMKTKEEMDQAKEVQVTVQSINTDPMLLQADLERRAADSLASMSDNLGPKRMVVNNTQETSSPNTKRSRIFEQRQTPSRPPSPAVVTPPHHHCDGSSTRMLCKRCRTTLTENCGEDLVFIRTPSGLRLRSNGPKSWSTLLRKPVFASGTFRRFGLLCKVCNDVIGIEDITPAMQIHREFACIQVLFQNTHNNDIFGSTAPESLQSTLTEVMEADELKGLHSFWDQIARRPTLPNLSGLYQDTDITMSDFLKKIVSEKQTVFMPPNYLKKM